MLICVDGTGPWSDEEYRTTMRNSFVRQLFLTARIETRKYWRGPSLLGLETAGIVNGAIAEIRTEFERGDSVVHLTGYSRGGHCVIEIAQELAELDWARSISIPTMALFDAVDRDVLNETEVIPGNVGFVYHAVRSPEIGSRSSFGNTGRAAARGVSYNERIFRATHAAMGGIPWTGDHPTVIERLPLGERPRRPFISSRAIGHTTREGDFYETGTLYEIPTINEAEDREGSASVRDYIWTNLATHGLVGR